MTAKTVREEYTYHLTDPFPVRPSVLDVCYRTAEQVCSDKPAAAQHWFVLSCLARSYELTTKEVSDQIDFPGGMEAEAFVDNLLYPVDHEPNYVVAPSMVLLLMIGLLYPESSAFSEATRERLERENKRAATREN